MAIKNKSLIFQLLDDLPVRTPLGFGIHENCRLTKVGTEPRKKDGQIIERNTYLSFTKYNDDGKAIANSEFSYFNLDHSSPHVLRNLVAQVSNLTEIVSTLTGEEFDPFVDAEFEDYEDLKTTLNTKRGAKKIQDMIETSFAELVEDKIGDNCPTLRVKIVTTYDGKYTEIPREGQFLELADEVEETGLTMTSKELRFRDKGLVTTTEKADNANLADKKPSGTNKLSGI